jgi:hypothetical protein
VLAKDNFNNNGSVTAPFYLDMNKQNKKLIKTLLKLHNKKEISAKTCADTIFRIIKNQ